MTEWNADLLASGILLLVKIGIFFLLYMLSVAYLTLLERRFLGLFQERYGPNRVGWQGLLQPLADGIKMFFKEDITVSGADKAIYILAPIVFVATALMTFVVIPFGNVIWPATMEIGGRLYDFTLANANRGVLADVDGALLLILAISSIGVYGLMMAGWGSNNKYALLGGVRASAQMISYELVVGLALVGVLMTAGSLSLMDIVKAQEGTWFGVIPRWFVFKQPLAFLLFLVAIFAETVRTPFDFTECENELVAGYQTEYSSMKFALFYLAEYGHVLAASALVTTFFLGGWQGPFIDLPGWKYVLPTVYFCAKTLLVVFLFIWVRATLPRFRYDLLMKLGWKVLLPAALGNILLTPLVMKLFGDL
ncbi:NADH dehydrogenase subunit H [Syntrophus gentianae]|uniref:NADH-quinone oxidoreductase subunit H n=1 Tax=Syntrophus gentianae TaxID=43775 RepID=A0A1H7ZIV4_9BACT|nr:NADH-quinone oxidoreductase subunit NuoH [Syntrophus gentianae]SEM58340.1 NADH dehydrogenase subunit H [Syntrophus gentianae]